MKSNDYQKMAKGSLLLLLLQFCKIEDNYENMEAIDNDFFHHMSAQLYITTLNGNKGYLYEEQIVMVEKFVDSNWDGSKEHFDELFNGVLLPER